jgi:hypothetical protein
MRAQGRQYHFDLMKLRDRGTLTQMPQDLSEELFHTQRRTMFLADRVNDDALREAITGVVSMGAQQVTAHAIVGTTITEADLNADLALLTERGNAVSDQLATALRTYL